MAENQVVEQKNVVERTAQMQTHEQEPAFDFNSVERKWQQKWFEEKIFEPKSGEEKPKFFLTVPYPYVSGALHVGHGRTYTTGDVMARYKRMRSFNVLWPMAFHITGTPVLAVSSKIAEGDAETIKLYEEYVSIYEQDASKINSIVKSFSEPWNVVKYFSEKIIHDFKSIGYSLDFSRRFTTGDAEYNKFIEWQFTKYREKGFLTQGSYPLLYCTKDKNAVGEDDIAQGDVEPVELVKYAAIKSKYEGGFIVSCTLRPETVFGITNIFVNPNATYVKIKLEPEEQAKEKTKVQPEHWFVSKDALEKLGLQNKKFEVVQEISGKEFVGKTCVDPLNKIIPILPADFVDPSNATGFVHSVPAHAPYDYVAIEDLKKDAHVQKEFPGIKQLVEAIKPIGLIKTPGYGEFPAIELSQKMNIAGLGEKEKLDKATQQLYKEEYYGGRTKENCMQFSGMSVQEAKEGVFAWLKRERKCDEFYETNRAAKCRCGGSVVAAILQDQWFLDFNAKGWKEKAFDCLGGMIIYPETYRKQFEDVFDWLDKRPCARRRGLGTKLPFDASGQWIIESLSDSTIYMAFYTVSKKIRENNLAPEKLKPEFFDYVFLGIGEEEKVAQACGVEKSVLESIRKEFLYWYPNDQRHTAVAHITNHLSFFIFAHAAIFAREHWPKAITLNEMITAEGAKMSKSKGNVVLLNDIGKKYSADLFRLYSISSADFESVLDFRVKDVEGVRKSLNKFVSIALKLVEEKKKLGVVEKIGEEIHEKLKGRPSPVKWMVSRFESALKKSTAVMEEYRLRDYAQTAFYELMGDWTHFLSRAGEEEKKIAASELVEKWIKILAPVIPHTCEELWEKLGGKGFVSLADWPAAREALIDKNAEAEEEFVKNLVADVRNVAQLIKMKPTKVKVIVAGAEKWSLLKKVLAKIDRVEELVEVVADEPTRKFVEKRFYELKNLVASGIELNEFAAVEHAREFLKKELKLQDLVVEKEEESREEKKSKAMPLKPALILS